MQFDVPDPAYTASERAQANFRLALRIAVVFVAGLWLIAFANEALSLNLQRFGVRPGEWIGIPGILFAPLLHGDLGHLAANSMPLVVLGTGMLYLYPNSALRLIPMVYLGPGIAVWLFAKSAVHIGASGLVYGFASYIFVAGVIRRDRRAIAACLLVSFLYGTLVWGVLPIRPGMSWQTHLSAVLIGVAMAIWLRRLDIPPRKRYEWEDEPKDE